MIEKLGDLFSFACELICIPTNLQVNVHNDLVMGAGLAKKAKLRFPGLPSYWGKAPNKSWPLMFVVNYQERWVVNFPTKNHWSSNSSITLIEESTKQLVDVVRRYKFNSIGLPRVGCGLGKLSWEEVKPILSKYLDDKYVIYHEEL